MTSLILNEYRDTEPTHAGLEDTIEYFNFTVPADGLYTIQITIPFTVTNYTGVPYNGACRIYLDTIDGAGVLMNGGQWSINSIPYNGRCSGAVTVELTAGTHTLYTRGLSSNPSTVVTLRSRRRYQVVQL